MQERKFIELGLQSRPQLGGRRGIDPRFMADRQPWLGHHTFFRCPLPGNGRRRGVVTRRRRLQRSRLQDLNNKSRWQKVQYLSTYSESRSRKAGPTSVSKST